MHAILEEVDDVLYQGTPFQSIETYNESKEFNFNPLEQSNSKPPKYEAQHQAFFNSISDSTPLLDVVYANLENKLFSPPYFIAVDNVTKNVIVSIRYVIS